MGQSVFVHTAFKTTRVVLGAGLALLLPGCFAGSVGAALGILSIDESDDGDSPPGVSDISVECTRTSPATIRFTLRDFDSDPVDVELFYECDETRDRVQLAEESDLTALETSPAGEVHTFKWHFAEQLGDGFREGITVWVNIVGGEQRALRGQQVGDDPPEILEELQYPKGLRCNEGPDETGESCEGEVVGVLGVGFTAKDTSDDLVSIEAQYDVVGDEPDSGWRSVWPALMARDERTPPRFALTAVQATRAGSDLEFFWDVVRNLENTRAIVRLRFRAYEQARACGDEEAPASEWVESRSFTVDNNSDPEVNLVTVATSPDKDFEVPLRFVVNDAEEHRVNVILQWAELGGSFLPLPDDVVVLRDLLSDPGMIDLRRELHVLTAAEGRFRGFLDEAPGLDSSAVRLPQLVREGLFFLPPFSEGPRRYCGKLPAVDPDLFLIGQKMRLCVGPCEEEIGEDDIETEIKEFDPRTSVATLGEPIPELPDGERYHYELTLRHGLLDLLSSNRERGGIVHTFVWDSSTDLLAAGLNLDTEVQVRAVGFDSEKGPVSDERVLGLHSSFLVAGDVLQTGIAPKSVALGDFNGDGLADIAVGNSSSNSVTVFLKGPKARERELQVGDRPSSVATGEVDRGNDRDDLLVAVSGESKVLVFYQTESDGLSTSAEFISELQTDRNPESVAAGDVNADGLTDVVVANASSVSKTVNIFCQDHLEISPPQFTRRDITLSSTPRAVTIGNLDGVEDGRNEVLVAAYDLEFGMTVRNTLSVFRLQGGAGGCLFEKIGEASEFGLGPRAIAMGDLLEGGKDEVVVVNWISSTISVFQAGSGAGEDVLSAPIRLERGLSNPWGVAVGDVSGDGKPDLVVTNRGRDDVAIYLPQDGSLPDPPTFGVETGNAPHGVQIGDLDGDGKNDVVVANKDGNNAVLLLQRAAGTIPTTPNRDLDVGRASSIAVGDVNSDGRRDILTTHSEHDELRLYLQNRAGNFPDHPNEIFGTGDSPRSLVIGDVDGDGANDVIVAGSETVDFFRQRSAGCGGVATGEEENLEPSPSLEFDRSLSLSGGPFFVALGDIVGNGKNDVLVAHEAVASVSVLRPGKQEPLHVSVDDAPRTVCSGDLDGDGRQDLLVTPTGGARRAIVYYQARGVRFQEHRTLSMLNSPISGWIGDVDGDGRNDAVVLTGDDANVYWQNASGVLGLDRENDGISQPDHVLDPATSTHTMGIGDLNGDGLTDVLLGHGLSGRLSFFFQTSTRRFSRTPNVRPDTAVRVNAIALTDVNGDGRNDVAISDLSSRLALFYAR